MATPGVAAELSSIRTALDELTRRITGLAERHADDADDPFAQGLFEVERTLGEALRRLERLGRA
jgi:hypothetical protein